MIRYDFHDKTVLVTGSSRGIGAATLRAFAEAGATCLLHFYDDDGGANRRDAEALAGELPKVHTFAADIRSRESVDAMMGQIRDTVGGFDILVNNAGILRDRSAKKMSAEEWDSVLDTNLNGTWNVTQKSLDLIRDGGSIVCVASIAGIVGMHGQSNYAASKAGVIALTKVLAKELGRRGISVNAVAPGLVKTSILEGVKQEVLDEYIKQIPAGRLAEPKDIANVVLFLASPESGYVTGQCLPITGGWY